MLTLPAASGWPQLCGAMENFLIPWVERRDTTKRPDLAPRSSIKDSQLQPTVSQIAEEVPGRSSNVFVQLSVVRGLALAQWVGGGLWPVCRARRGCALGDAASWPLPSQVTARGPVPGKEGGTHKPRARAGEAAFALARSWVLYGPCQLGLLGSWSEIGARSDGPLRAASWTASYPRERTRWRRSLGRTALGLTPISLLE